MVTQQSENLEPQVVWGCTSPWQVQISLEMSDSFSDGSCCLNGSSSIKVTLLASDTRIHVLVEPDMLDEVFDRNANEGGWDDRFYMVPRCTTAERLYQFLVSPQVMELICAIERSRPCDDPKSPLADYGRAADIQLRKLLMMLPTIF
jgi:hypothetical protein